MILRKFVRMGAAAGALVFTVQADAADFYGGGFKDGPSAFGAPLWSGFYAGINGGGGWRDSSDQFSNLSAGYSNFGGGFGFPATAGYGGLGADGGFGGGQIGYNWQGMLGARQLVTGIEADFQGSSISNKNFDAAGDEFKTNLDWFGTVRGRLGYTPGSTLFYFTGGFAYGRLVQSAQDSDYSPTAVYKSGTTVTGYVLGGGLEYKLTPSWSVKAEYQYLNFGKNDAGLVNAGSGGPATASLDGFKITDDAFHTARLGLNYSFSSAYVPLK